MWVTLSYIIEKIMDYHEAFGATLYRIYIHENDIVRRLLPWASTL